jgi:type IV pilus assembly protein PilA
MLARIRKSMDEKDQGFTLIELLVVMIIIGILAAIAIPVFLNQRQKAVESSMKSDLRTVANQMETYFTDNSGTGYAAPSQAGNVITVGTETVNISAGNTLSKMEGLTAANAAIAAAAGVYPASAGFCLTIHNPGAGQDWSYNSLKGGLSSGGAACP